MMSVLLAALTGLCMTRVRTVWFVCSGWGSVAAVDECGMCATTVSSLRTAVSTADAVTAGTDVAKVFWKFSRGAVGERPVMAHMSGNVMQ
jgi:hypothetical protein